MRTGRDNRHHDYNPLWHRKSIYVAGCVCNRARSAPTASASLDQPTMSDHHSACSHSQQTACNTFLAKYVNFHGTQTPAHLGLLILCVVLPIDLARRCLVRRAERGIADLRWEVVFEVEETCLAHVARLCAGLADHCCFEAHACAWVPAEDSEWTCAGSAFTSELLL